MSHENGGRSPGPWTNRPGNWSDPLDFSRFGPVILAPDGDDPEPWRIAFILSDGPNPEADAEFIVRAVNAYDELAASVKRLKEERDALLAACKAVRKANALLNGKVSYEVWNGLYDVNCQLEGAIAKANGQPENTGASDQ